MKKTNITSTIRMLFSTFWIGFRMLYRIILLEINWMTHNEWQFTKCGVIKSIQLIWRDLHPFLISSHNPIPCICINPMLSMFRGTQNILVGGWPTPLKNIEKWWSEYQLGLWHSQVNGKSSNSMVPKHQTAIVRVTSSQISQLVAFTSHSIKKKKQYPLVMTYIAMERSTIFYGKIHYFYGHFQ